MTEELPADSQGKMIVFGAKKIRRAWVDDQWYFSVSDIVGALTDSASAPRYWDAMKRREKASSGVDLSTFCRKVPLTGADGKTYKSDAVNTEGAFRIIQSIPSPKAEPFKRWLAQVGRERVEEIENPELAQQRMKELYKQKGYPDDWIEKRVRGIAVRDELTGEKKKKDKAAKVSTARNLWVPAINNHGGFGRWGFVEVHDPWYAKSILGSAPNRNQSEMENEA